MVAVPATTEVAATSRPPGAHDEADAALLRVSRVVLASTLLAGNAARPALSATQIRTLSVLQARPEGTSLNAVAERLGATASATSRICGRLVRDGLLDRAPGPGNEIRLTVSSRGLQALTAVNEARLALMRPLLGALDPTTREHAVAALAELASLAERADAPW